MIQQQHWLAAGLPITMFLFYSSPRKRQQQQLCQLPSYVFYYSSAARALTNC